MSMMHQPSRPQPEPVPLDRDYVKIARRVHRTMLRLDAGSYKYQINTTNIGVGLKFLTLTSSPRGQDPGRAPTTKRNTFSYSEWLRLKAKSRPVSESYRILKLRIQRKYPDATLEYIRIRTSEGHGVLHIVGNFPFIPYEWLVAAWIEIHASDQVNIQNIRDEEGVKWYLNPYIQGQTERMSSSWSWVYRGWRVQYQRLKTVQYYKNRASIKEYLNLKNLPRSQMVKDISQNYIDRLLIPPFCNIAYCRWLSHILENGLLLDSLASEIPPAPPPLH